MLELPPTGLDNVRREERDTESDHTGVAQACRSRSLSHDRR